jgi:hypothetical protein
LKYFVHLESRVMKVDVKGIFFHRVLGISAGLPMRSRRFIQIGNERRRTRLTESMTAVEGLRMTARSALTKARTYANNARPADAMMPPSQSIPVQSCLSTDPFDSLSPSGGTFGTVHIPTKVASRVAAPER